MAPSTWNRGMSILESNQAKDYPRHTFHVAWPVYRTQDSGPRTDRGQGTNKHACVAPRDSNSDLV